jgi:RimJ/RimL family protein N-acetyltransferase
VGLLSYRAANAADVPLLVAWHDDPEVSRYWDGETFSEPEMRERLERTDVDMWILEEDGVPVGHLQSWWAEGSPRRGGIDGFLIPSARGRGIMPAVAAMLARDLLAQGWTEVTVDPYEWNERAIRGWAKAGFVEVSRGHQPDDDHTAPWVLMRFEPACGGAAPAS